MKKVVLAFSGGLDTSYCAIYLSKDLGYEVHTITVNTGGFNTEEVKEIGTYKATIEFGNGQSAEVDEACYRWGSNEQAPAGPSGVVGDSAQG